MEEHFKEKHPGMSMPEQLKDAVALGYHEWAHVEQLLKPSSRPRTSARARIAHARSEQRRQEQRRQAPLALRVF